MDVEEDETSENWGVPQAVKPVPSGYVKIAIEHGHL